MRKCKCGKPAMWLKHHRKYMCDACAQAAGYLVPCHGEAHKPGSMADHCWVCMPRWGLVEVMPPISREAYRFVYGTEPPADTELKEE